MAKLSTRALRIKSRTARRRQALKIDAPVFGQKESLEQKNKATVDKMAAFVKANK